MKWGIEFEARLQPLLLLKNLKNLYLSGKEHEPQNTEEEQDGKSTFNT